jgi:hypothetical protein
MKAILLWLQQPSSVAGISAIVGAISALALHQLTLAAALPLISAAVVSILLPDNAGATASAKALARELTEKLSSQEKI